MTDDLGKTKTRDAQIPRRWTAPTLQRLDAGDAENGFVVTNDGPIGAS